MPKEKDGKEESLEERLRALAKRIEELELRLSRESLLLDEVMKELQLMRNISLASALLLRTTTYIKGYRYDDISRHIVEALLRAGPMNISQLTNFLKKIRGTASRRIVSEKIKILNRLGLVERVPGKRSEKRYRIRRVEEAKI